MSLTKKQRDALPDDDFAVPETRDLPIQDKNHIGMAWKMVDKTKGLSDEQRKKARNRILRRAKELGMDTSEWDMKAAPDADENIDEQQLSKDNERDAKNRETLVENDNVMQLQKAGTIKFSALAMEIPDIKLEHPNRMPFSGVLTKLDEPSDNPLSGSDGKRVILPKAVAEKALSSLLGMAIDFTPNLDGHDVQSKIGLITDATIVGNELHIHGYFYSADFPSEVKRIQAEKSQLGFSYEAQAHIRSLNDDPLVIKDCVFTGAAVLYKDKAAYTTTSLAASKMEQELMNEELKKMLDAFQATFQAKLDGIEAKLAAKEEKEDDDKKMAAGSVAHLVAPHVAAMRACANGMEAAGFGMHASQGHVAHLNKMADNMEAEAAVGKLPSIYQGPDFYHASEKKVAAAKAEANPEIKKLQETIDGLVTQVTDLEKSKFAAAAEPERKTLTPAVLHLLSKAGIGPDAMNDKKLTKFEIDALLKDKNLSVSQRMQLKQDLMAAGRLAG